jgi:SAM-dependent methyltransferase
LENDQEFVFFDRVIIGSDIPHEDSSLTLIISAQAAHWFDLPHFYSEVKRTLKTDGVFALIGYAFVQVHGRQSDKLNEILTNVFY